MVRGMSNVRPEVKVLVNELILWPCSATGQRAVVSGNNEAMEHKSILLLADDALVAC